MTTAKLTADPYFDFREKLTILVVLKEIKIDNALRILAHVEKRYPSGNAGYCETIIAALKRDLPSRRNGK